MAKKKSDRLKTVLWLAELKQKQAAEALAQSMSEVEAQQQQAQQLRDFQQEYKQQFQNNSGQSTGLPAQQLQNMHRFYGNLDSVIEVQQQQVELLNAQQEQLRDQWRQLYARQKNVEGMVDQAKLKEEQQQESKLQRELDDRFANRKQP